MMPPVSVQPGDGTLAAALRQAPTEGTKPFRILLAPGTYREKLVVDRPWVHLIGPLPGPEGAPAAQIVWDDRAGTLGPDGQPLGTFGSQTLAVLAPDFRAERVAIVNDWPYDPAATGTQAVALKVDGASDRTVFLDCHLEGGQDTLYANAGRQLYLRCTIGGHVDFLFGAGQAVFEDCRLLCHDRRGRLGSEPVGWVSAPSTRAPHQYGFLFSRCRIEKGTPSPAPGSFCLGRPWHPSFAPDTVNAAIFKDCWMDDHIRPEAWTSMDSRPGGVLTTYQPEEALLFESGSWGPGAVAAPTTRRRFLTEADATHAVAASVFGDWSPRDLEVSRPL